MKTLLAAATVAAFALASAAQASVNLVTNGDFSAGNTGFTSGYAYSPATNNAEGQYTVTNNPFPWNPNFASVGDHTGSGGMMFVGNGSPTAGQLVWNSGPIAILAGTDYFFEAFVANVCCNANYQGGNSPPNLGFSISLNGGPAILLNTLSIPLSPVGAWNGLSTSFNSGVATTATLSLINANTIAAGNDFAVDDIFLGTQSTVTGGIPEPTTWAMLILGFGGIGAAIRRRRRLPAFAA
jgi:hypothetical protein